MRKFHLSTLRWVALFLFLALFAIIVLRWISLERLRLTLQQLGPQPIATPVPRPELPTPTPWRTPIISGKLDTAKLWSGITIHAQVDPTPGGAASVERVDPESYVLDLNLKVRVPTPNRDLEELAQITPQLPKLLPQLAAAIGAEPVLPLFQQLYDFKIQTLRQDLVRLDQLLSRHNFYDCQTILRLRNPQTKREAILLQADMDVDADGSDADRLPLIDGSSANFRPFTSYRWRKKTATPNPFLAPTEAKLRSYETEFTQKGLSIERNRELRLGIDRLRADVDSLKRFSFLIASTDPYIVLPGIFTRDKDAGKVGDYAVVVYGDQIYPAIVGDIGPADRVGEASLRIAKEINVRSTASNRSVSELKVSYLIFPKTAETPFGPPDLEKIYARCETLVQQMGGASVPLHRWENLIPTPTPASTPTPTPTPTASPTPAPSASPNESPIGSPTPIVTPTFAFPMPSGSPLPAGSSTPTPIRTPSPSATPALST